MPIPTRSLSLREPRKQPPSLGRSATIRTASTSTTTKTASLSTPTNTPTTNENVSLRNKSFLPVRDDSRSPSSSRLQQQQDIRLAQRGTKSPSKPQEHPSHTPTLASRRQNLIRTSPLKTSPSPTKTTTGTATPKRATFVPAASSPAKQNGRSTSPKKTEMPPPPRPTRSASLRQPTSSSSATPTSRSHVRHRSQVIAPASNQSPKKREPLPPVATTPRSKMQSTSYQQQSSPRKPTRSSTTVLRAGTPELDPSLIPSSLPEIAELQTELLQLSLLHLSSLREEAEWKDSAEKQLRVTYDAVAEKHCGVVKEENDFQRQLNGQALDCWFKNGLEHNGGLEFTKQIQVLSRVAQEVCDLSDCLRGRYTSIVQEFESWFGRVEEIRIFRQHQDGRSGIVLFIDPLDSTWKEEVHTMTMNLELCLRQLQSLDVLGYGEVERLEGSSLYRTARGLDDMLNLMIEELNTTRKIEADVVRTERQWVSQLSKQIFATRTPEKRTPRVGIWEQPSLQS
ncbi:hypothetical protein BDV25DRAFT_167319 [Aspergillus avenaceus]|uniref:Uncharacterized protein n=1 Tax=Aspergillus avenaceus TaxID=36643 RepID=A0A5N6TDA3_ASPAV|nr:hypothetical protein BDV25DRAFT_167319 [Aspergillus avenaceus]